MSDPGEVQIPMPQPVPVLFDVNALKLGTPGMPSVKVDIYSATGIHVAFMSANQAVQLATVLMEEAKKARSLPANLEIAHEIPPINGHNGQGPHVG